MSGWLTINNGDDGQIHVVPNDNKHKESKDCWCHPALNYIDIETNKQVWSHNDTRPDEIN